MQEWRAPDRGGSWQGHQHWHAQHGRYQAAGEGQGELDRHTVPASYHCYLPLRTADHLGNGRGDGVATRNQLVGLVHRVECTQQGSLRVSNCLLGVQAAAHLQGLAKHATRRACAYVRNANCSCE